jgi:hypothetical protein
VIERSVGEHRVTRATPKPTVSPPKAASAWLATSIGENGTGDKAGCPYRRRFESFDDEFLFAFSHPTGAIGVCITYGLSPFALLRAMAFYLDDQSHELLEPHLEQEQTPLYQRPAA